MKLAYELTPDEVIIFNNYHLGSQPAFKKKRNRRRFLISALYVLIGALVYSTNPQFWPFAYTLAFLGVMWFIFYPRAVEYRVARTIQKSFKARNRPDSIPHEISISPDGLYAKNDVDEGLIPWQNILRVVTRDAAIYLYLNAENAIIIPKDALDDDTDWDKLVDSIESNYYQ